jgi:hypothetical protein
MFLKKYEKNVHWWLLHLFDFLQEMLEPLSVVSVKFTHIYVHTQVRSSMS